MKKRIWISVLAVCLLLVMVPAGVLAAGRFTVMDLVYFARAMAGVGDLTQAQQAAYDINGDGKLDIMDLVYMAESLAQSSGTQTGSAAPAATTAPSVCDTCHQYPCVCSTSQACSVCGQTNCAGHHSTIVTPSAWTCGTCHSYPCACHSSSGGSGSWGTASTGHHGTGHHHA